MFFFFFFGGGGGGAGQVRARFRVWGLSDFIKGTFTGFSLCYNNKKLERTAAGSRRLVGGVGFTHRLLSGLIVKML